MVLVAEVNRQVGRPGSARQGGGAQIPALKGKLDNPAVEVVEDEEALPVQRKIRRLPQVLLASLAKLKEGGRGEAGGAPGDLGAENGEEDEKPQHSRCFQHMSSP